MELLLLPHPDANNTSVIVSVCVCVLANTDCISVSVISMQSDSELSQLLKRLVEGRKSKKINK